MRLKYSEAVRNTGAYKIIDRDLTGGVFNHAYLVLSEDKVATDAFISLVLCRIFCSNACMECHECRKVLLGSKPDVKIIGGQGGSIGVDDIASIVEDAVLTSFEGGRKVYVIKDFDKVTEQAQNKLLKTLEEPEDKVHFILTTAVPGAVLPTVQSRSKQINLSAFPEIAIRDALISEGADRESAARVSGISDGSLTKAEMLLSDKEFVSDVDSVLEMLSELKSSADVHKYICTNIFAKDKLEGTLGILELVMRDILTYTIMKNGQILLKGKDEEIAALSGSYNKKTIAEVLRLINISKQKFKANCAAVNIADGLLLKILEVKYECR